MSDYGSTVDAILAKGARYWTKAESRTIEKLVADGHREKLKQAVVSVRNGAEPQISED